MEYQEGTRQVVFTDIEIEQYGLSESTMPVDEFQQFAENIVRSYEQLDAQRTQLEEDAMEGFMPDPDAYHMICLRLKDMFPVLRVRSEIKRMADQREITELNGWLNLDFGNDPEGSVD